MQEMALLKYLPSNAVTSSCQQGLDLVGLQVD